MIKKSILFFTEYQFCPRLVCLVSTPVLFDDVDVSNRRYRLQQGTVVNAVNDST